jgi:hypothetical protein
MQFGQIEGGVDVQPGSKNRRIFFGQFILLSTWLILAVELALYQEIIIISKRASAEILIEFGPKIELF